jgi:hypothetical protein
MHDLALNAVKWLENTGWATQIRSTLLYPFIQVIHFSGLTIWLGTNTLVDLRLLGVGKKGRTAAQLSEALFTWNWIGFSVAILGGFLLFSAVARTYLINGAFQLKLGVLVPLALTSHVVVQQKVRAYGRERETSIAAKLAGAVEMLLWLCVITTAVEIPNH